MNNNFIIILLLITLILSCNMSPTEYKSVDFNIQRWFIDNETYGRSKGLEIRIVGTFNNWGENSTDITEIWNNSLETTFSEEKLIFIGNKKLIVGDSHKYTLLVKYIYHAEDYIETIEYVDTKWLYDNKNIIVTPMDQYVDSGLDDSYYTEFVVK